MKPITDPAGVETRKVEMTPEVRARFNKAFESISRICLKELKGPWEAICCLQMMAETLAETYGYDLHGVIAVKDEAKRDKGSEN